MLFLLYLLNSAIFLKNLHLDSYVLDMCIHVSNSWKYFGYLRLLFKRYKILEWVQYVIIAEASGVILFAFRHPFK